MDAEPVEEVIIGVRYTETCNLLRNLPPGTFDVNTKDINSAAFCALKNNKELSTDWDQHTTAEECLIRVGLTYKFQTTNYKDQNKFNLCLLNVKQIRELGNIDDIKYTPIWHDPPIVGQPNNLSHTDVCYEDVELRLKMKGIAVLVEGLDYDVINAKVSVARAIDQQS